jgi:hypothetical protein
MIIIIKCWLPCCVYDSLVTIPLFLISGPWWLGAPFDCGDPAILGGYVSFLQALADLELLVPEKSCADGSPAIPLRTTLLPAICDTCATDGAAAKARQERQAAQQALSAASAVAQTEQAARKARAAAQRLRERDMASTVGPAGGIWGSASPDAALKLPLRVALQLVGDVAADKKSAQ